MALTNNPGDVLEDLHWLADTHVGLTEAAKRTGFPTPAALNKWLYRNGQQPLLTRLLAHEPAPLTPSQKAS